MLGKILGAALAVTMIVWKGMDYDRVVQRFKQARRDGTPLPQYKEGSYEYELQKYFVECERGVGWRHWVGAILLWIGLGTLTWVAWQVTH